jgi:hypothetical protein
MTEVFNTIDNTGIISWKGQTIKQISSFIKKNEPSIGNVSVKRNLFLPQPIKSYRRELATSNNLNSCNARTSSSIDVLNMPGGTLSNSGSSTDSQTGLVNTYNLSQVNSKYEVPGSCAPDTCVIGTPQSNARARLRSSGMIKKNYDPANNKSKYYANSKQYLNSRSKTFEQNQYIFIREGDSTAQPGSTQAAGNLYSPAGESHCPKHKFDTDVSFGYKWFDEVDSSNNAIEYTVNIPAGYYNIEEINNILKNTMTTNYHYYENINSKAKFFLLEIKLNNATNNVELEYVVLRAQYILDSNLQTPIRQTIQGDLPVDWTTPSILDSARFVIHNNDFKTAIGFSNSSDYPSVDPTNDPNIIVETRKIVSNVTPLFKPLFTSTFYKPSNSQFATQGAVSSSSLISRMRYNTITDSASTYKNAYGLHVANALAYGVPANGYTVKDKIGYHSSQTPGVDSMGNPIKCTNIHMRGG